MKINLPSDGILIPDFKFEGEVSKQLERLEGWLEKLCLVLEESFKRVYRDISMGTSRHRVLSSIPSASDLGEGEIVFYDDGAGTVRLYTKVNGSVKYVNLS